MNTFRFETINSFETGDPEHRLPVKIPRESSRRRMLAKAVRMAEQFESDILFRAGTFHIDGKYPLIAFTLLNALKGQTIEVIARGCDSAVAVQELSALFERRNEPRHLGLYSEGEMYESASGRL
jgi:phosphotransferase system HPr-like phosphotransfer protein